MMKAVSGGMNGLISMLAMGKYMCYQFFQLSVINGHYQLLTRPNGLSIRVSQLLIIGLSYPELLITVNAVLLLYLTMNLIPYRYYALQFLIRVPKQSDGVR